MAVRPIRNAVLLGECTKTCMEHDRHGCHVVMGECPIPRVLMDWQPLVKHDHRHEMGMGQYPAPGVHCGSYNRTMVMGCCAIPGIHLDRKPLGHDPYRHVMGLERYPQTGMGFPR